MGWYGATGRFIGGHMAFIAPVCVVVGVVFARWVSPVEALVPALFAAMTFQGALNNRFREVAEVFRHPLLLLSVPAVSLVAMPCVACLLARLLFADDPQVVCGIVLEYCVPVGVVSYMWVGMYGGNRSLALALILLTTVAAPFTIPLSLEALLGATVELDVAAMMGRMLTMIAIPAVAGMVVNDATHGWGERVLSPALGPAARVLLVVIITANSTGMAPYLATVTVETFCVAGFVLLFATGGFALGYLLARALRRGAADTVTACFCCGIRNISAGAVIAAQFFPGPAVFAVMMGTLFQQVLAGLMGKALGRLMDAAEE